MYTCRTDPFPPPNKVHVMDINLKTGELTFNWSSVLDNCPAIHYDITTISCGTCPRRTMSNQVTCHDVVAGHVCTSEVRTVACGTITGNPSNSITVTLKGTLFKHPVLLR